MSVLSKVKSLSPRSEEKRDKRRALAMSDGERLVERSPYYTSPSFIAHAGEVSTIVQLYSEVGSNRNMRFQDVIDFIPVDPMSGIKIYMFVNDSLISGDEKKRLITDNASGNKEYFDSRDAHNQKKGNDDVDDRSQSAVEAKQSEIEDYDAYERLSNRPDPVVCYRISLMVVGRTREAVEEQLNVLNTSLDKRHPGAQWSSVGGDQTTRYRSLLDTYSGSPLDMTATAANYGRLNFGVSPGLTDPRGVPIGRDAMALSVTDSVVDFDRYLRQQAIIATPSGSTMPVYEIEPDETNPPSLSSQLAQVAANQITANGHRAHHIVLNDWDYATQNERNYQIPAEIRARCFKRYDVSRSTINVMQGFGDVNDVVAIYNRLVEKIVNIFDVLLDLKMDKSERGEILNMVDHYYRQSQFWNAEAAEKPMNTTIVGIANPDTYPTTVELMQFINNELESMESSGNANRGDRIRSIYSILNQAVNSNTSVMGRTTSIENTDAPQVFYEFDRVSNNRIRQVQLLNMIEYIAWTADKGDVIVIHGMDNVYEKVAQFLNGAIKAAQKNGVRFIFSFDCITSPSAVSISTTDMFKLRGLYYQNLDANVDYTVVGRCDPEEVEHFGTYLNMKLSDSIIRQMQYKTNNQVLFHRSVGRVNNFVATQAIL